MWNPFSRKGKGSIPKGMTPITLYSNPNAQYFYQELQTFPWPNAPAHEQVSALVNCWSGNQLPGSTNFIPGVPLSNALWNIPTSYANALQKQTQFNKGFNIQNSGPVEQSNIWSQAIQNWQNRSY